MALRINDQQLSPIPLLTINKSVNFSADDRPISSNYVVSLNGTLLPDRGSPTSSGWVTGTGLPDPEGIVGDAARFSSLTAKQELLREAFGTPGYRLQYETHNGPVTLYPRTRSISFAPNVWVQRTDYTIELDCQEIDGFNDSGNFLLSTSGLNLNSISDDWSITERPNATGVFDIARTVSATARTIFDSGNAVNTEAWLNAKTWVDGRLADPSGFGVPIGTGVYYNRIDEVSADKTAGIYTVRRSLIQSLNNYVETRSVTRNFQRNTLDDSGSNSTTINVQGTIEGLDPNNDPSGKLLAASGRLSSVLSSLPAAVGANGDTLTETIDYNESEGSINYTVVFNNFESTYSHSYDVTYNNDGNSLPTVIINGQIAGISDDGLPDGRFGLAVTGWINDIRSGLRPLAFEDATNRFQISETGFLTAPVSKNVIYNRANGTVNYNYTYGFSLGPTGVNYQHDYTIDLSTEYPTTLGTSAGRNITASIQGVINGVGDTPSASYNNAESGWNALNSTLFGLVNSASSLIGGNTPPLLDRPSILSVSQNKVQGAINYNATFNNRPATPSGVAVASVTIDEQYPQNIFAVQIIPGRLTGPILQNIRTINERSRTINVSLTMGSKGNAHWEYADIAIPRGYANNFISSGVADLGIRGTGYFVSQDSDSWDWRNGTYSRALTAVYASGELPL